MAFGPRRSTLDHIAAGWRDRHNAGLMPLIAELLHGPRFRPHWRALLGVLIGVFSWLAFRPGGSQGFEFEGGDKLDHLLAFGTLGVLATLSFAADVVRLLSVAAALLAYGGFIEIVQTQLPTRTGEWADVLADAVGVVCGLALALALRRHWTPTLQGSADRPPR
jgi:VanZ family protein